MTYSNPPVSDVEVSVLVADRTRATLYRGASHNAVLIEVESLAHPESRLKDQELVSDSPGLSVGMARPQGSATQAYSPHEREAQQFAQQIAERLGALRTSNQVHRLYLVAEPHFLGLLRAALDVPTQKLIAGDVPHRLTDLDPAALRAELPQHL
ncbi:host attachment protein [Sinimarinibacterium sp. CAU 1509]|uniref:host attachment protein n=1 Tax=Sinimarinibacterium sp. CAU 1509 TaxID=2562283 RepID=UPI00146F07F6|nr:host attachment protein [Sinimarinibacterium sp. CAU 1509]